MTKEEIMNTYAIEQGYESWECLMSDFDDMRSLEILEHIKEIIDLIQEELKKKIANEFGNEEIQQEILNTEIL